MPISLDEDQVMELLKSFGELKAFNLVKDNVTGLSKGYAYCEYMDSNITDIVCEGLNGMDLADQKLIVQRSGSVVSDSNAIGLVTSAFLGSSALHSQTSRVLLLMNMVTPDDLAKDNDYEGIIIKSNKKILWKT